MQILNKKHMKPALKNSEDSIQSFIGDLTGCSSTSSDERDLAYQWYQRARGMISISLSMQIIKIEESEE